MMEEQLLTKLESKYIPITFRGESIKSPNYADAAIATIDEGIGYLSMEVLSADNQNYNISGTDEVNIGDTVRKSGRTTGVTENNVTDTSATVKVYYTSTKWAIFKDQILVEQPFIESGDSGSLDSGSLVDRGGSAVGHLQEAAQ